MDTSRYLTADLPGIGGVIKEQVQDFVVEELPLYPASGQGEHTFFEIEKTGLSTFEAVRLIAQALGISPNRISHAGLKDARAVTRQVLSVHGVSPEGVLALDGSTELAEVLPGLRVLWAERHRNKLKIGHLRGNRFTIRIRQVDESALSACRAILAVLERRGVPNYYGPQRFGMRGDSARLGRFVVQRDAEGFVKALLGGPHPAESQQVQEARARVDAGRWAEALPLFPGHMAEERRALQALIQTRGDYRRAYATLSKQLKTFLLSAYQSELFNRVLDARLQTLDRVHAGDLAMKHPGRSVFRVENEAVEQPRADRFEISPTGPIYGYKMIEATGKQGALEAQVLAGEGLTLEDFRVGQGIKAEGTRRALRFQIHEPELWYDEGVMLRFWLARGCYATAVLAEITKTNLADHETEDVSELTDL
jgi:tRNA pseudouridine13 synthase